MKLRSATKEVVPFKVRKPPRPKSAWGTPVERERKRRIDVAVWAYAYEIIGTTLVDDAIFDATCAQIDKSMRTGNLTLDIFFKKHFSPDTGLWVHKHPHKKRLAELVRMRQKFSLAN